MMIFFLSMFFVVSPQPSLQQALHEAHGEEVPGHVQHQSPVSEARPVAQDLRGDARPAFGQGQAKELTDAGNATEEALLEVAQRALPSGNLT